MCSTYKLHRETENELQQDAYRFDDETPAVRDDLCFR